MSPILDAISSSVSEFPAAASQQLQGQTGGGTFASIFAAAQGSAVRGSTATPQPSVRSDHSLSGSLSNSTPVTSGVDAMLPRGTGSQPKKLPNNVLAPTVKFAPAVPSVSVPGSISPIVPTIVPSPDPIRSVMTPSPSAAAVSAPSSLSGSTGLLDNSANTSIANQIGLGPTPETVASPSAVSQPVSSSASQSTGSNSDPQRLASAQTLQGSVLQTQTSQDKAATVTSQSQAAPVDAAKQTRFASPPASPDQPPSSAAANQAIEASTQLTQGNPNAPAGQPVEALASASLVVSKAILGSDNTAVDGNTIASNGRGVELGKSIPQSAPAMEFTASGATPAANSNPEAAMSAASPPLSGAETNQATPANAAALNIVAQSSSLAAPPAQIVSGPSKIPPPTQTPLAQAPPIPSAEPKSIAPAIEPDHGRSGQAAVVPNSVAPNSDGISATLGGSSPGNSASRSNLTPFSVFFSGSGAESAASVLPKAILPPANSVNLPTISGLSSNLKSNSAATSAPVQPPVGQNKNAAETTANPTLQAQQSAGQSPQHNLEPSVASATTNSIPTIAPQTAQPPTAAAAIVAGAAFVSSGDAPPKSPTLPPTPAGVQSPISHAAETLPATTGPVQLAQIVSRMGQTEMRIGMNTSAFGNVEVRTVVHANDVGLVIGSEKGDLRSLLANELPALTNTLQQQNLRLNSVNYMQGFAFSNDNSGGGNAQQRFFSPAPQQSFSAAEAGPDDAVDSVPTASFGGGRNSLSILA